MGLCIFIIIKHKWPHPESLGLSNTELLIPLHTWGGTRPRRGGVDATPLLESCWILETSVDVDGEDSLGH